MSSTKYVYSFIWTTNIGNLLFALLIYYYYYRESKGIHRILILSIQNQLRSFKSMEIF